MKLFNKLILFFTIALAAQLNLNSMEGPKIPQSLNQISIIQQLPSNIRQNFANHFDKLPDEVKLVILQYLSQANTAESIKEIFENLRPIRSVNREFYNLVNDKNFLRTVIKEYLSKKTEEEKFQIFFEAIRQGETSIFNAMLLAGINPNIQSNNSTTALMWAALHNEINIVKTLLDKGADPNVKNSFGYTALIYAAIRGYSDIVKALLDKGADPNVKNNLGDTALMLAAKNGHADIVTALLDKGADPNVENNNGQTALDLAERNYQKEIVDLISQYMLRNMLHILVEMKTKTI